jgi:hypothetical protein
MPYTLAPFESIPLTDELLEHLIEHHELVMLPRYERLWKYFRNDLAAPDAEGGSAVPPSQWVGLPARLRDRRRPEQDDRAKREVVIENDIAWRIHTLVDFMFPKAPSFVSRAKDAALRARIEETLSTIFELNGGIQLWQDAALLGGVYGHVDFLVDCGELWSARRAERGYGRGEAASDLSASAARAALIRIEAVEAPRAIPLLNPADYRALDAYIIHYERPRHDVVGEGLIQRLLVRRFAPRSFLRSQRATTTITEIFSATHRQQYEDGRLVREERNPLGLIPIVHVQNQSQPFRYEGLSDVEPLIPLQDELNTRLSDRANRVTMQSFRMWLGKGIDGFTERPIGPGQMWMTDNTDASIEGFGGDADSPSERAHIEELREALDKTSGVTPAAAGHIKAKVGNLTSENALRISLMGTIAKIKRKRITYARGISEVASLVLHALDLSGVLHTGEEDRGIEIAWPDPLPADESRRIEDALRKAQLGVPLKTLRAELGYGD